MLNAWYDHFLLGRQNGILDILPPVLIEDDQEHWWSLDGFPPREQPWLLLELSADGHLVEPGQAQEGALVLHDYLREYHGLATLPGATTDAQEQVVGHPTSVAFEFTTPQELRLVGRSYVSFSATSSQASTHWAVRLEVVGDDCDLNDAPQSVCQNTGYHDSRHRNGIENPSDVAPGEPYWMNVTMYPQYDVVPAGSTVRLVISNDDGEISQDPTNSLNTLLLGGTTPAFLGLPLAPAGSHALPHDELPPVFPGYLEP